MNSVNFILYESQVYLYVSEVVHAQKKGFIYRYYQIHANIREIRYVRIFSQHKTLFTTEYLLRKI